MKDLYLIGNGFDLAHGLKTSYNDFLLWYLNDFLKKSWRRDHHEDDLLKIDRQGIRYDLPTDFKSIENVFQKLKDLNYKLKAKHDFLGRIIESYREYRWVDVEYEYYMALVDLYKSLELNPHTKDSILIQLKKLNLCFSLIKRKLVDYLSTIKISNEIKNCQIERILFESTGAIESREEMEEMEEVQKNTKEEPFDKKLFVCFNYTSTIDYYLPDSFFLGNTLFIHGEIALKSNSIIFGYGDEMDPHYEKIENLNIKQFLDNMKSFGYFRTDNYQRVIRFIESGDFTVKILGHSCGLSDRILLNTIFEHDNCKHIKIYYYQRNENENDYFEKTQEISRHFRATMKGKMREKIVPLKHSVPLPQNTNEN